MRQGEGYKGEREAVLPLGLNEDDLERLRRDAAARWWEYDQARRRYVVALNEAARWRGLGEGWWHWRRRSIQAAWVSLPLFIRESREAFLVFALLMLAGILWGLF